jgi:hypothetical protein
MAGYTYTSLKQAIQDYTDNDESVFVSQLDSFIQSTEERILKTAPLEVFRKNASATITSSNKYVPKPSDWLYTYSLSVQPSGVTKFLLNKDVNFIQEYWPDPTATGEPKYYADFDVDNFIVAPTPDSAYTAELHYFYRPVSLTDDASGVTWLSENAGPAMLYGSLVEAYTFMKGEPDMIAQYENFFQAAMQRINAFAQAAEGLDFYRRSKD